MMMHRNKSVDVHSFAMVPSADIPRSAFNIQTAHKTTFDAGLLVPVYLEEILPGDSYHVSMTAFARLSTPIFPVMDNMYLDSFFFFVPTRLLWDNFEKFMGFQENPGDSISFLVPTVTSPAGGFLANTIYDYFGLPCAGQVTAGLTVTANVLPLRAYNLIYNEWFRDQNLQSSPFTPTGDGPDANNLYALRRRGKRHDYFTSALPFTQKGTAVSLPLGTSAPIRGLYVDTANTTGLAGVTAVGGVAPAGVTSVSAVNARFASASAVGTGAATAFNSTNALVFADLTSATAATINQIRQAFQIQKLLERDARGGTRYTEIVRSHFGVVSPDARLNRPEYLGGGSTPIVVSPIAQTSATSITGGATPQGNLSAVATGLVRGNGFQQSFTEHGYVIGLVAVRADLTYQQGMRKLWSRSTRYDFYWPVFSALGEQAVLNREIYADGSANDAAVFGYQERWAEYRYHPSMITGLFRSTAAGTLDPWHLAQRFTVLPTLNATFIEDNPPVSRIVAVGAAANGKQFIFDSFFDIRAVRPLPMYGVPGLIDHF